MAIKSGFGILFDLKSGRSRGWYMKDGIKRWADNDEAITDARCEIGSERGVQNSLEDRNEKPSDREDTSRMVGVVERCRCGK